MSSLTISIAIGVIVLLVAVLVYMRWGRSSKEELEEEMLPDDSDVDLVDDDNEEFTIIDNQ